MSNDVETKAEFGLLEWLIIIPLFTIVVLLRAAGVSRADYLEIMGMLWPADEEDGSA